MQYTTYNKRARDEYIEHLCADYVDHNWFTKLPPKSHYDRVTDFTRQINGEDVVLTINGGTPWVIDEKAKVEGLVNTVLSHPSFEVLCRDKTPAHNYFVSWFATHGQTTTHYAMISIAADRQLERYHECELVESDIKCMVYSLINKTRLTDYIETATGRTMEQITQDAWDLIRAYESDPKRENETRVYLTDPDRLYMGKPSWAVYLRYNHDHLPEQPVNLVISRDILRHNGLIQEVYIDGKGAKRYQYTGNCRNDTLRMQ